MIVRKIWCLLVVLCLPLAAFCQQDMKARQILDDISSAYKQTKGVYMGFNGDQQGQLLLSGERFMLDMDEVKTWFDGKTQWSYLVQNNEVNVSCPTPDELQTINPFVLLSIYKKGFNYYYLGTEVFRGLTLQKVKLVPVDRDSDIESIIVSSDIKSQIRRLRITDNFGNVQQINIEVYKSGMVFDDTTFRFDKNKYPEVELIDLR